MIVVGGGGERRLHAQDGSREGVEGRPCDSNFSLVSSPRVSTASC